MQLSNIFCKKLLVSLIVFSIYIYTQSFCLSNVYAKSPQEFSTETLLADSSDTPVIEMEKLPKSISFADLNSDSKITISDFTLWIGYYSEFARLGKYNPLGDYNNDNRISISDFSLWLEAYSSYAHNTYTTSLKDNPVSIKLNPNYSQEDKSLVVVENSIGEVYFSTETELSDVNYKTAGSTTIPTGNGSGNYTVFWYCAGNDIYYSKRGKLVIHEVQDGIAIVPTMNDTVTADSTWCGTFQLVWNDMKNEIVKQDVVFTPQLKMVENLNKEDFNESMLSEESYYKTFGLKTLELKEEIENGIKKKFNITSDILDDFDWSEDALDHSDSVDGSFRYFLYAMLYKEFNYLRSFRSQGKGKFGENYDDVKYFGIGMGDQLAGGQMYILYYKSEDDFAIMVNTDTNDEVIFYKNPKGNTFNEMYANMNTEANNYTGDKSFNLGDEFKAPYLEFNVKRNYSELKNKRFPILPSGVAEIYDAIQTISFYLDENGGKIKSEAGIDVEVDISPAPDDIPDGYQPRYFYLDDTFTIFLREKGKEKPYFASLINDITKFQTIEE